MKTQLDLSKLYTISAFSRKWNTSRKRVYSLLNDKMLDSVTISGVIFIDTSDKAVLENAMLSGSSRAKSNFIAHSKPKISENDTFDSRMDKDFEQWERNNMFHAQK